MKTEQPVWRATKQWTDFEAVAMVMIEAHCKSRRANYGKIIERVVSYAQKIIRESSWNTKYCSSDKAIWQNLRLPRVRQKMTTNCWKGLPKVKASRHISTWTAACYFRLWCRKSPGWYEHIWKVPTGDGIEWMAKSSCWLRKKNKWIPAAHGSSAKTRQSKGKIQYYLDELNG
jgi:hypothetical protein